MNEYEKRKQAIRRYLDGENVTEIVKSFGKTRPWFYNWLKRYQTCGEEGEWFLDRSRAPKTKPTKVASSLEEQVVEARKRLEEKRMAQTGAVAIEYELNREGIKPPPVWTINRILARHGLIKKKTPAHRSEKEYPELFFHTHQMDLVGPRWLKENGRFYSVNILDTRSHICSVNPVRTKASLGIAQALSHFWTTHGMPDALQMDNELAFRGSNRYPHSFGVVVRFALALGIAPVFIPVKEPWRNGMIEKFNHTWDKRFFRTQNFSNFEVLQEASHEFAAFHNANHRYSSQHHKTPEQMSRELPDPWLYDGSINLEEKIPLEQGSIYFIRFIRSDLKLHLPNESFPVHENLKYSYVVAEISVENHCLLIEQNNRMIQSFEYFMPIDW